MSLPTLNTASYELTLPSSDVKVKYRPFLVKEEKVLLQALESQEVKQVVQALKDIVSACTFGQIDVNNLPTFDLEFIFLQIRSKSVGEIANIRVLCPDDKKTYVPIEVDLTKIDVQVDDSHTNNIILDKEKNIGLIMKYPTLDSVDVSIDPKELKTSELFKTIRRCIHQIYEGEKVYNASDYTEKEMDTFLDGLTSQNFKDIQNFFNTIPALTHEVEVTNPKTNVKGKVVLRGLQNFFV
jgi:hypothetical protein